MFETDRHHGEGLHDKVSNKTVLELAQPLKEAHSGIQIVHMSILLSHRELFLPEYTKQRKSLLRRLLRLHRKRSYVTSEVPIEYEAHWSPHHFSWSVGMS